MSQTKRNPLRPLLVRALERESTLSPALAELAWTLATSTDDEALMVLLAQRVDIPDHIRAGLAEVKAVAVRVKYLSRPDIDPAERQDMLSTEKRGTVLALLAGDADCDRATLEELAHHKTLKVTHAVLTNESAPLEVRRAAALHMVKTGWTLNGNVGGDFHKFVREDEEGHDQYVMTFEKRNHLRWLVSSTTLGEAAVRRLVNMVIVADTARAQALQAYSQTSKATEVLSAISGLVLSPVMPEGVAQILADCLETVAPMVKDPAKVAKAWERIHSRSSGTLGTDLRIAIGSTDPVLLDSLVHPAQDPAVLMSVAKNRAATPATTVKAVRGTDRHTSEVVQARSDQDEVLFALWQAEYDPLSYWTPNDDQVELGLRCLAATGVPASKRLGLVQRMLQRGLLPSGAAGLLPIEAFDRRYLDASVSDEGLSVLDDALVANPVSPDMLLTMVGDFDGSLHELIQLCAILDEDSAGTGDEEVSPVEPDVPSGAPEDLPDGEVAADAEVTADAGDGPYGQCVLPGIAAA